MEAHEAMEQLLAGLPVTERRIDLAGVSTAVLEGGEGPPVVLLHGPGEFAAIWLRVIPELALTHRVLAPDLPGHGSSEVSGGELDADRTLAWLAELIDHTCPSPPVLVGKLLGGSIAARYAAARGHTIDGSCWRTRWAPASSARRPGSRSPWSATRCGPRSARCQASSTSAWRIPTAGGTSWASAGSRSARSR